MHCSNEHIECISAKRRSVNVPKVVPNICALCHCSNILCPSLLCRTATSDAGAIRRQRMKRYWTGCSFLYTYLLRLGLECVTTSHSSVWIWCIIYALHSVITSRGRCLRLSPCSIGQVSLLNSLDIISLMMIRIHFLYVAGIGLGQCNVFSHWRIPGSYTTRCIEKVSRLRLYKMRILKYYVENKAQLETWK